MSNSEKKEIELYSNLGKLFYAIAHSDGKVHRKEINHLRSYIRSYWLEIDAIEDEFGTDAAFRIETTFDWSLENERDAEISYKEFRAFYLDQVNLFTPLIKRLVLDTAKAIANAYAGKNKAELILLSKIEILFRST